MLEMILSYVFPLLAIILMTVLAWAFWRLRESEIYARLGDRFPEIGEATLGAVQALARQAVMAAEEWARSRVGGEARTLGPAKLQYAIGFLKRWFPKLDEERLEALVLAELAHYREETAAKDDIRKLME